MIVHCKYEQYKDEAIVFYLLSHKAKILCCSDASQTSYWV